MFAFGLVYFKQKYKIFVLFVNFPKELLNMRSQKVLQNME